MGAIFSCFGSQEQPAQNKQTKKPMSNDQVILKTKLQRDKIITKRNHVQSEIDKATEKIKQLVREKKKQQAIYYLGKKKVLVQNLTNIDTKLTFLNGQIDKIEQMEDEIEFTNTMKESNKVLKDLMNNLDVDAVREAAELQQEVDMNSQEIQQIVNQNMQDDDIMKEFEMLGGNDDVMDVIDNHQPVQENTQGQQKQVQLN